MQGKRTRLGRRLSVLASVAALAAVLILPQAAGAQTAADPRIEAARAKGKVTWYTSVSPDELRKGLIDEFTKRTGIEVNSYYGGTGQVFSRLTTERKTKSFAVDVVTLGDTDLVGDLIKDNVLRGYKPADLSAVDPAYKDPDGKWYGITFWGLAIEYNSRLVQKDAAPKSWSELADPKWKSKVAISDPSRSAAGLLFLKAMVHENGWEWVEKLMRNDPLVIAIAPGIDQAVANGERPVATAVTSYTSEIMQKHAPVAIASDGVLFVSPLTASIITEAPNPEGAELLVDFLLSKDAGELYRKYGWFSTRGDVAGPSGFPPASELKVAYKEVPSPLPRQELLDKFNAIAQAARK